MKKIKIKWLNVIKLLVLIFCVGVIIKDFYMLTIYSTITGRLYGWTWFGFITFLAMFPIIGLIIDDFEEQTSKKSTTHDSRQIKK